MRIGDLVRVANEGLRTPIGSLALVTRVQGQQDSRGTTFRIWARMMESGHSYFFQPEHLEVISASR